jgi:hypothetical protein
MNAFFDMLSRNKSGIFLGVGIGGMISAAVGSWILAPMARDAIEEKKAELGVEKLSAKDAVLTVGPYAVGPLLSLGTGIACTCVSNQMNLKDKAAAMAAATLYETTNQIYREKTKEIVGEQREKRIREATAKEIIDRRPVGNIVVTGNGECLCYDNVAKQYFRSNITRIQNIINDINFDMNDSGTVVTVDNYCLRMGLEEVILGNELGWRNDVTGLIKPDYSAIIKDGEACIVISHLDHPPKPIHGI